MKNSAKLKSIRHLKSRINIFFIIAFILWGIGFIFYGGLVLSDDSLKFSFIFFIFAVVCFVSIFPRVSIFLYGRKKYYIPSEKITKELYCSIEENLAYIGFTLEIDEKFNSITVIKNNICYLITFYKNENYFKISNKGSLDYMLNSKNKFLYQLFLFRYYHYLRDIPLIASTIQNLAIDDFSKLERFKTKNKPIGYFRKILIQIVYFFVVFMALPLAYFICCIVMFNIEIQRFEKKSNNIDEELSMSNIQNEFYLNENSNGYDNFKLRNL